MSIPLQNPITVTSETLNLDSFWLSYLNISASDPNKEVKLMATVEKVQKNADGSYTKAPHNTTGTVGRIFINDLYKACATDMGLVTITSRVTGQPIQLSVADIIDAVTLKVKQMAEVTGVI